MAKAETIQLARLQTVDKVYGFTGEMPKQI